MKKLLLGLITLLTFTQGFAQTFTTDHGDSSNASWVSPDDDVKVANNITNTSSTDLYLKWRMTNSDTSNGWKLTGFCDNVTCYTNVGSGWHVTDAYVPNVPGNFYALFNGNNAPVGSSAWIEVNVHDTVSHYQKTLIYVAYKGTNNVVSVTRADDNVVLYPNPARNSVNVVFNQSMGVKNIAIYNLIGKAVSVYKVNGNSAKLELNEVPSGIYFVRLMNSRGQIVATRKFTKQ